MASFSQGQSAVIEGRNEESTWWYVGGTDLRKMLGGGLDGGNHASPEGVPVMVSPHLEGPVEGFVIAHLECEIKAKKNSNRVVWQDNPEETGYRIYRNGEQIAELAANITKSRRRSARR